MNTAMGWSVLLIMMIYAFGRSIKSKEQDSTSSAHLRVAPCTLIVGRPSCIQLLLPGDPKVDKKDLFVWKRANGTTIDDVPSKEDFIFEGMYKSRKEGLDFHVPVGYCYIWNSDKLILTIFIEEVGPQHEGAYVAEYLGKIPFHLKVLAAPPSTQAPDTSTDGVKDSCAADAHREDSKDWKHTVWGMIAVICLAVTVLGAYWIKQKRTAASKKTTGKEETNDNDQSGQDETTDEWNASGTPSGDNSLLLRGVGIQRAGQQSSVEGCNSSSNDTEVQMATGDASSDHRTGDHSTMSQRNAA